MATQSSSGVKVATPRFGVWAPVYGNWGLMRTHPEDPFDASYARTRRLIRIAEEQGFVSTLLAQHIVNPFNHSFDQLETWSASAALAEATESIEIIAAIKPLLLSPAVLAKIALGIDEISGGRFSINLVSAWYRPEIEGAGLAFPEHDERYAYSREWLHVVRRLLHGERFTYEGTHVRVQDFGFQPGPVRKPGPLVYLGGESEPARQLAADEADVFFINGRPLAGVKTLIDDVARRPRRLPEPLRYGLAAFVIARETDDEAQELLREGIEAAEKENSWTDLLAGLDPKTVMFHVEKIPHLGTNGGTGAELVGSYDTVARRIVDFAGIGIETFMLEFQPLEREVIRFGQEIIPRVERLLGRKSTAAELPPPLAHAYGAARGA